LQVVLQHLYVLVESTPLGPDFNRRKQMEQDFPSVSVSSVAPVGFVCLFSEIRVQHDAVTGLATFSRAKAR
jgi:hypothetical protein